MIRQDYLQSLKYMFHARQFAYDMLRRFFLEEPSKEYLQHFVRENLIDLFPFAENSEQIKAGIVEIKGYLTNHDVIENNEIGRASCREREEIREEEGIVKEKKQ